MSPVIGIDLGTTYSVIAHVTETGQPEVIPNLDGEFLTPSVIDFSVNPPLVGVQAKERQAQGEEDTEAFFKRAMHISSYQMEYFGRTYGAAEMSALVLEYLKRSAENYFNAPVTDAVITVPAYFQETQRSQTLRAAELAGLNVLRLINEPTAAILAYRGTPGKYLVYDLGGGTFDVTLSEVTSDSIDVLAIDGDHELGGKDWDDQLLNNVAQRFLEDTGEDLFEADISELRVAVEKTKIALSQRTEAPLKVNGRNLSRSYTITRRDFEQITANLLDLTIMRVEHVLEESRTRWEDLNGVLLVGGSTRMPKIREAIERRSGKPPLTGVHPDQVVALGAALEAQRLVDERSLQFKLAQKTEAAGGIRLLPTLNDITAHTLGMVAEDPDHPGHYVNSLIIPRGSRIPQPHTKRYTFRVDDPLNDQLKVYVTQGEDRDLFSGEISFLELRAVSGFDAPGVHTVDVTLSYDRDAVVHVSAEAAGQALRVRREPLPDDIPGRFAPNARRNPLTVYLIFDVSGSMRNEPLREAKEAATEFIRVLQPDDLTHIGIMTVADEAKVIHRPSSEVDAVVKAVESIWIGKGQGNKGEPFGLLNAELQHAVGDKFAVVMADGRWVRPERAVNNAKICHSNGIDVISVGFGNQNISFLKHIASAGRDSIYAPRGGLVQTYNSIARELKLHQISGRSS
jgi:molecular chaperone DnaK (HSP70)